MRRTIFSLGAALFSASALVSAEQGASCSLTKKCPEETPCCSQYGQCGAGAYCLGGCDPRMSFSLDSCTPEPVCQDRTMKMDSLDRIVDVGKYLGDASKADWVAQGKPKLTNDGKTVLLTMPKESPGTVLASTVYLWYGTVKARLRTGRGKGVVTAFILLSDVKDEIDFEFVGSELGIAQTNYYFQGIPDYTHSGNITELSDTFENFHDYEIRWTPDDITWLVDGQVRRVQKKADTWNKTSNQWDYPQTPSRLQISLWPGGAASNAPGTIGWAGGPIDWESEDIKKFGFDYATFGEISIECYKTKSAPGTNSGKGYLYKDASALNNTVEDSDRPTVLKSLLGTGRDMDKELPQASASSKPQAVIPGMSGGGPGTNGQAAGNALGGGTGTSGGSGGDAVAPARCTTTAFSQNCNKEGGSGSSDTSANEGSKPDGAPGASTFAVLVGLGVMLAAF